MSPAAPRPFSDSAPPQSVYAEQARKVLEQHAKTDWTAYHLAAILEALRADIERGYLTTVQREAREEVFDDLLGMATEINTRMHPAPAAVLAGAVLEEHLRQLTIANDLDASKPNGDPLAFEQLGHGLVKAEIIRETERKQAAGWYALRTEGAHGTPRWRVDLGTGELVDGITANHPDDGERAERLGSNDVRGDQGASACLRAARHR
jgi:hypothetical protein